VPVELTEHMLDEADFAMQNHVGDAYTDADGFDGWYQPVWKAILAASPTAPAQSCGDAEQADEAVTLPEMFKSPLTSFGMLVRALRIVADTTLYDMAKALSITPATLSAIEFGRKPLTEEMVIDAYVFFTKLGVLDTLHALNAARAKDSK
jgi:DNA-binding XRE family transcriptional regulator